MFREDHRQLSRTVANLASFERLIPHLRDAVSQTIIVETNSRRGSTPDINWAHQYAHILIGGEVLSRGYTIKGLTVTYMPRSLGIGQADTIQQRARWFGYKDDYLGYCRVYLPGEAIVAYKRYVEHEEHMRNVLREFVETNRPLSEWKRTFFLAANLKPTRTMVLDLDYFRGNYSNSWFRPQAPHDEEEEIRGNREAVERLLARYGPRFEPNPGHHDRTEDQRHLVAVNIKLRDVYEDFLWRLRFSRSEDSAKFTGLLLQIDKHLEVNGDDTCVVYQMNSGRSRKRSINNKGVISNLFQGYHPAGASRANRIYPGDDKIHKSDQLTIQIHNLQLVDDGVEIASNVPTVAVWLPRRMSADWISQHQT